MLLAQARPTMINHHTSNSVELVQRLNWFLSSFTTVSVISFRNSSCHLLTRIASLISACNIPHQSTAFPRAFPTMYYPWSHLLLKVRNRTIAIA